MHPSSSSIAAPLRSRPRWAWIALSLVLAASSGSARAQELGQAAGFPIGQKSRIHTDLELGGAYDTNPDRARRADATDDARVIIRPGIRLVIPGQRLNLNVNAGLSIGQYVGLDTRDPNSDFGGNIGVKGEYGRDEVVGVRLIDDFTRTPAFLSALGAVSSEERTYRAWYNRGEVSLLVRPGGGALELQTGYTNEIFIYDTLPNSQQHGVLAGAKLHFLPKTAMFVRGDLSWFSSDEDQFTLRSTPFSIKIGVIGQVTSRLSANLEVGYGDTLTWENGFFSEVSTKNRRTVIGAASLTWSVVDSLQVSAGYTRTVRPIITFNNVGADAFDARLLWSIGAHVQIGLYGHLELRHFAEGAGTNQVSFPTTDPSRGRPAREALLALGDARLSYWWTEFLATSLGYRLIHQDPDDVAGATSFLLSDYTRHQGFLAVQLSY